MNELVGLPVGSLAPSALLGIFVIMVFTGLLVPWRIHQKAEKTIDFQRRQMETKDEIIKELSHQSDVMEDGFRVVEKLGRDLQRKVDR